MTTSPGRKRSQHLIEAEAYRRIIAGDAPAALDEFAQQLLDWLRQTYPEAAPTTLTGSKARFAKLGIVATT